MHKLKFPESHDKALSLCTTMLVVSITNESEKNLSNRGFVSDAVLPKIVGGKFSPESHFDPRVKAGPDGQHSRGRVVQREGIVNSVCGPQPTPQQGHQGSQHKAEMCRVTLLQTVLII